jgi:glycosyltransferase involved in cell wall biosynthesis
MNKIKMTLLLSTFNRLQFLNKTLPEFIRSAILNNCQLLIIDNGSTDGTNEYLKKIKKKYKFITYFKRQKNIGAPKSYKHGISMIKTKYFMILSDDDYIYGDYIKKTISILDNDKNVGLVHHYFYNHHSKKIDFHTKGNNSKKIIFNLSASMTGLAFRNKKSLQSSFIITDNKIYPQVDLCMYVANNANIALLNNAGFLPCRQVSPEYNFIKQNRSMDFGLNERVAIAKKNFNLLDFIEVCDGLFLWQIYILQQIKDKKTKKIYCNNILEIFNIYSIHRSFLVHSKYFNLKNFMLSILNLFYFKTLFYLIINFILFIKNALYSFIIFFYKKTIKILKRI